jgi:hypothetical protein
VSISRNWSPFGLAQATAARAELAPSVRFPDMGRPAPNTPFLSHLFRPAPGPRAGPPTDRERLSQPLGGSASSRRMSRFRFESLSAHQRDAGKEDRPLRTGQKRAPENAGEGPRRRGRGVGGGGPEPVLWGYSQVSVVGEERRHLPGRPSKFVFAVCRARQRPVAGFRPPLHPTNGANSVTSRREVNHAEVGQSV